MPLGIGAAGGISNAGGTKGLSKDPGGGNKAGSNSRSLGRRGATGERTINRKTLLTGPTGDTPMSEELEIDPLTGEPRFDPKKKRKKTVLDLDGTPTLDELRNAQKALLGY